MPQAIGRRAYDIKGERMQRIASDGGRIAAGNRPEGV